ncbi:MAG: response regulator transcription factor [Flavobacteriales bacterium]|nr:response regulator transcription factor [Flavobacteriales bacterium]
MIRVTIIDDDAYIRDTLSSMLREFHGVEVSGAYEHPLEAISMLRQSPPDLLLLDIRMPGMNGFELLDQLDTSAFEVIFITSFDQYAIQAIKYSALDYLLKPIQPDDLRMAIERFRKSGEKVLSRARIAALKHNILQTDQKEFYLVIPTRQGDHHFRPDEIVRCEADSNYTLIYLKGNRKFMASKTLSDIESMLEESTFLRVHKSHLVNKQYVERINHEDMLVLEGGGLVPVSRRRLPEVKGWFQS